MTTKRKIAIGICSLVVLLLLIPIIGNVRYRLWHHEQFYGRPRQDWKELAVSLVARRAKDLTWLTQEIATLKAKPDSQTRGEAVPWVSENLIRLRNGEWIVYTNICNKQDGQIHDLFIGQGSEGKWYYSDYHFCIGMYSLAVVDLGQPDSIKQFLQTYSLREFDGRSDQCFKETWGRKRPSRLVRQDLISER